MDAHACTTYLSIWIQEKDRQAAEESFSGLGARARWDGRAFVIGYNAEYAVNVNDMLRVTLKGLFGKEGELKALCERFGAHAYLEIVPEIVAKSEKPKQILSLEKDIVAFLYLSGVEVDLDYYIV